MKLLLLYAGLLLQAPTEDAESGAPQAPGPPERMLLQMEMPQPGVTVDKLLQGPMQAKLVRSPLWEALASLPGYPAVQVGWASLLAPAGGDARLFVDSLAGDGLNLLLFGGEGEPRGVVVALGHDGDLAQDCLAPALQLMGVPRKQMRGEDWTVPLGDGHLRRRGDRFLLASDPGLLDRYQDDMLETDLPQRGGSAAAADAESVTDLRAWLAGDLLRADGYPPLPEDAGASYLTGEIHEVLRTAAWIGVDLRLEDHGLKLAFAAPVDEQVLETHAPFFPEVQEVPMPELAHGILEGVFARDLAHWWAARNLYMSERGVAETVEGDGVMTTLFGRDPGSEVYLHLESEIRLIAASLPASESADLSVEYPAGALGLRLKEDAPEDLGDAFANAFFSAITFANFDGGAMGESALSMDIHALPNGRIYAATYPKPAEGTKAPQRNNFSPSLLLRDDGELWFSSSLGLLEEIAAAPVALVPARGMWLDFRMEELAKILRRDRSHLVANRMLEEGGDLEAAEGFIDMVLASLDLVEGVGLRSFLDGEHMRLEFELHVAP